MTGALLVELDAELLQLFGVLLGLGLGRLPGGSQALAELGDLDRLRLRLGLLLGELHLKRLALGLGALLAGGGDDLGDPLARQVLVPHLLEPGRIAAADALTQRETGDIAPGIEQGLAGGDDFFGGVFGRAIGKELVSPIVRREKRASTPEKRPQKGVKVAKEAKRR